MLSEESHELKEVIMRTQNLRVLVVCPIVGKDPVKGKGETMVFSWDRGKVC